MTDSTDEERWLVINLRARRPDPLGERIGSSG